MLAAGSRIALTACSHGLLPRGRAKVEGLVEYLDDLGIEVTLSPALYLPPQRHGHFEEGISASRGRTLRTHNPAHSAPDPVRARILNEFFADPSVDAIFDVSGGAIANGVLPYLDWDVIRENPKPFVGYSDLSTVVNAIHTQTGRTTYLWQILALGSDESAWEPNVVERYGDARERFEESFLVGGRGGGGGRGGRGGRSGGGEGLFELEGVRFLQGDAMGGPMVGGNLNAFLKLAGTELFPPLEGRILALEALSSDAPTVHSMLTQLKLIGAFEACAGVLLGEFTRLGRLSGPDALDQIVADVVDTDIPIARTDSFGHSADSRALRIGGMYEFADATRP